MPEFPCERESFESDEDKFQELLMYICERSLDDPKFSSTKLNKILFYAEFWHYGAFGTPITGHEYMNRDYGPAPYRLLPIRTKLVEEGALIIENRDYFGKIQKRPTTCRKADLARFSADEIKFVDWIIDELRPYNASGVSDLSHDLAAWEFTDRDEVIPYEAVFLARRGLTEGEREHGKTINAAAVG